MRVMHAPQVITGRPGGCLERAQRHCLVGGCASGTDSRPTVLTLPRRVENRRQTLHCRCWALVLLLPQQEKESAISLKLLLPIFEHVLVRVEVRLLVGTKGCSVDSLQSFLSTPFSFQPFCSSSLHFSDPSKSESVVEAEVTSAIPSDLSAKEIQTSSSKTRSNLALFSSRG